MAQQRIETLLQTYKRKERPQRAQCGSAPSRRPSSLEIQAEILKVEETARQRIETLRQKGQNKERPQRAQRGSAPSHRSYRSWLSSKREEAEANVLARRMDLENFKKDQEIWEKESQQRVELEQQRNDALLLRLEKERVQGYAKRHRHSRRRDAAEDSSSQPSQPSSETAASTKTYTASTRGLSRLHMPEPAILKPTAVTSVGSVKKTKDLPKLRGETTEEDGPVATNLLPDILESSEEVTPKKRTSKKRPAEDDEENEVKKSRRSKRQKTPQPSENRSTPEAEEPKESLQPSEVKGTPEADNKETPQPSETKRAPEAEDPTETLQPSETKETPDADSGRETPQLSETERTPEVEDSKETPRSSGTEGSPEADGAKKTLQPSETIRTPEAGSGKGSQLKKAEEERNLGRGQTFPYRVRLVFDRGKDHWNDLPGKSKGKPLQVVWWGV